MVKIKSIYFSLIIVFLILLASFDVIFMKGTVNYSLFAIYAVILSLSGYALHDAKMEKKHAAGAVFVVLAFVFMSLAQYVFSFHQNPLLWAALLFLAAAFVFAFMSRFYLPEAAPEKSTEFDAKETILLGLILLFALFLRLYKSDLIPPGIWFDEGQNGNEVLRILSGKPFEIFIPRFTMMPAMYFYIAAFFVKIFGVNIEALRLVSVAAGILSIAAFYYLCRHIFKDKTLALAGAFLLATSRWHIIFSRVAFLGMLTLLLVITCFYFYLKSISEGKKSHAAISGISMGFSLYTFSGANFVPIIMILHLLFSLFNMNDILFKRRLTAGVIALLTAAVIASPLAVYALKNPAIFSKRFTDLTIANDIKKEKSLMPLLKSVKTHLLMFNYEGDYNGRHNLYKKPMLDMATGVLFAVGLFIALTQQGSAFYLLWFFIMLCAGIFTISIEAPQAYRIIGILPVIYIFAVIALQKIRAALYFVNKSYKMFLIFICVLLGSIAALNIYQYFVLYPAEDATYLSFSPEANAISGFIRDNSRDNYIYVTTASKLYGFYPWEQKLISDFANYGGHPYEYFTGDSTADEQKMAGKNGIILLLRPSDTDVIAAVEKEYPGAVKKEYANRITDEIMFVCYYIEKALIRMNSAILPALAPVARPGKQNN